MSHTVSECHDVRFVESSRIRGYGYALGRVKMVYTGTPVTLGETPGSVRAETEPDDKGTHSTEITMTVAAPSADTLALLEALAGSHLAVIYTDSHGRDRVAGAPHRWARLTYSETGGIVQVTITVKTPHPDGVLDLG